MEGLVTGVPQDADYVLVDTRNDKLGKLRMYGCKQKASDLLGATVEFDIKKSTSGNVYAKFLKKVDRNQAIFNTEDRSKWYLWGEDAESDFINKIVPEIHRDIRKHPDKNRFSWSIDLFDYTAGKPADLKVQNTPFFTVSKYSYKGKICDPSYCVTFNRKDYENYLKNYPDCDIYYWVHWTQLSYRNIRVREVYGVWRGDFSKMAKCIQQELCPLHSYTHRENDDHNAKDSYVFCLLDTEIFEKVF